MKDVKAMKAVAVGSKIYKSPHGATEAICYTILHNIRRVRRKRLRDLNLRETYTTTPGSNYKKEEALFDKAYRRVRPIIQAVYDENK